MRRSKQSWETQADGRSQVGGKVKSGGGRQNRSRGLEIGNLFLGGFQVFLCLFRGFLREGGEKRKKHERSYLVRDREVVMGWFGVGEERFHS